MTATTQMAEYCLKVIETYLSSPSSVAAVALPALPAEEYGCFVTLTTLPSDRLRGCIGTLQPGDLSEEMGRMAISAAFRDSRFPKVTAKELPKIRCCVSLLHSFESCKSWSDWEVGTHGIIAVYGRNSATYLPSVAEEQGWDQKETIINLLDKAGYDDEVTADVLKRVKVTRYQVSKASVDYKDMNR